MIDDMICVTPCGASSIIMNAMINNKVESKRLEFGPKKCFQISIGEEKLSCPTLKVHDDKVSKVESEKYLGDTVTNTLNHDKTITKRYNEAIGTISDILVVLNYVSRGYQYIKIGLILRESILLSKLLLNVQVWPRLTDAQVKKLEQTDLAFQRKILSCPKATNLEIIYSELNTCPLKLIISEMRLL